MSAALILSGRETSQQVSGKATLEQERDDDDVTKT
jgi:hypothetical protein